jgi:hypothetical protein
LQSGGGLGRECRNSIERDLIPYVFLELGCCGSKEMHVFDGVAPNLQWTIQAFKDDLLLLAVLWS